MPRNATKRDKMKSLFYFALVFIGLLGFSAAHAVPDEQPVLSVVIDSFGGAGDVLAEVWADGSIVWSKDQKDGGPPYLTAKIAPAKTTAFLAKLEKDGVFKQKPEDLCHLGPDATYHRIVLIHGKQNVILESWHELAERDPETVATSTGIHYQVGKAEREKLVNGDEPSYKAFRKLWKEIRDFTTGLIPKEGKPFEGKLKEWPLPGNE
jgi:hypothetical protein